MFCTHDALAVIGNPTESSGQTRPHSHSPQPQLRWRDSLLTFSLLAIKRHYPYTPVGRICAPFIGCTTNTWMGELSLGEAGRQIIKATRDGMSATSMFATPRAAWERMAHIRKP